MITLGRNGHMENLLASDEVLERAGISFYPTDRGGDVTYHGPGQLVGYPILDLREWKRDVGAYVRGIEQVMIDTLAEYGIAGRAHPQADRRVGGGSGKIAAIGVHISRWVTSHGFALNVDTDLSYFQYIVPCGLTKPVTSMARARRRAHSWTEVSRRSGRALRRASSIARCVHSRNSTMENYMTDVVMPQMGESIVEGTLTKWLKKPGEHVERDEPLFEISTDKVDTEIPSPAAGIAGRNAGARKARRSASTPWSRAFRTARRGAQPAAARPAAPQASAPAPAEPAPIAQPPAAGSHRAYAGAGTGGRNAAHRPAFAAGAQDGARKQYRPCAA